MFRESATAGAIAAPTSPFDRLEWYALLEQSGFTPFFACASDGSSRAILALDQTGARIAPLRNWYAFTWKALAPDGPGGDTLLARIAADLKSRAHRVTLEPVPKEYDAARRLADAFASAGWRVEVTKCDVNHVIHLRGQGFAEYWAQRPGPLRTTLKRKAKKVTIQIEQDFDEQLWEHYESIYAESWKPEEDHPQMLRAFAQAEAKAGRLRLGLAYCEKEPVAAQFWTVEQGCAYIHKLAHLERYKNLSAGTTLSAALFEHVIDRDKVELVDFGTGDQPYKSDWMGETRLRYRIDCLNMKSPRSWLDLAKLTYSRLKASTVPKLAQRPAAG